MPGKQPSIFEVSFKKDSPAEIDETAVGYVDEGYPFVVRCIADEGYTDKLFVRKRNDEKLHKREYVDEEFSFLDDGGVYECEATGDAMDEPHVRRLRILPRINLNLPECSNADREKCGENGACAIIKGTPTCFCRPGFVGANCESNLITEYVHSNFYPLLDTVTMAGAAGGTVTTALVIVAIILSLMFLKEKRKTRQLLRVHGPVPAPNAYGELPEVSNPYKKMSTDTMSRELPRRMDSPRNAFRSPRTALREDADQRLQQLLADRSLPRENPPIS